MEHRDEYAILDLARGLSALVVLFGHLWAPLFGDIRPLDHGGGPFWIAIHFFAGKSRCAVMAFFVLSGFFVGGSVLRAGESFRWKGYLVARLSRLWVVMVPALLLAWGIGIAGQALWGFTLPAGIGWGVFAAQLVFLQGWVAPCFGLDGPLWSLSYEFWYYLLFPALALALWSGGGRWTRRVFWMAAAMGLFLLLPPVFERYAPVWLVGALAYAVVSRSVRLRRPWFLSGAVALVLVLMLLEHGLRNRWGWLAFDWAFGGAFALAIFGLLRWAGDWRWSRGAPVSRFLADVSFSLYLTHAPLVWLLEKTYQGRPLSMDGKGAFLYLGWAGALFAWAVVFWWAFERHYPRVRRWAMGRLGSGS